MPPPQKSSTRIPSRLEHIAFIGTQRFVYPLNDQYRQLRNIVQKRLSAKAEPIINQRELRVIGLRRTGNHAIINWITQQQPGTTQHLNNVAARTNPYRHKADNLRRYHPEHGKMAAIYERQAQGNFVARDCLIHSYEDWSLKAIAHPQFERNRTLYLGNSAQRFEILILRDPFNLFASRLKQGFITTKVKRLSMVDLWLEYAKEWLNESHHLPEPRILINYNRWFADVNYRCELAAQLGLPFSDQGISEVMGFGAGSSFDGTALDGQAKQMRVTQRWKVFANDSTFRQLFKNEALWHYSEAIFGHIPETEQLRDS